MNIERWRSYFPVTQKYVYLDHAAVGPLSSQVVEAVNRITAEKTVGSMKWMEWEKLLEDTRKEIAHFIGSKPSEIALTGNTSEGIGIVANGVKLGRKDNIVTVDYEFPTNIYPWQYLASQKKVELRTIKNNAGRVSLEDFRKAIDNHTRLVAVSHVQYSNGYRTDLAELAKLVHEAGGYLLTDAVQSLGHIPISVSKLEVDFLATSGYKWLLSPIATGFFYVRENLIEELDLSRVSYRSDARFFDFSIRTFEPAHTARRFEHGQLNFPGFAGMLEAIRLLTRFGIKNVWSRIRDLRDCLADGLMSFPKIRINTPSDEKAESGILNFTTRDVERLHKGLTAKRFIVSKRLGGIRVSPHFYNTKEEILSFLRAIDGLL